jgi:hypothetical protein
MSKRVLKAEEVDAIRKFYAGSAIVHDLCDTIEELRDEIHEWEESDKAGPVFTSIIDEQNVENARLKAALEVMRRAMFSLANESSGFVSMADPANHGITNIRCLQNRIDEARAALSDPNVQAVAEEWRELRKDRERLDWLEARRQALNRFYRTQYGWRVVLSHNVVRAVVSLNDLDVHDSEPNGPDLRAAIDAVREAKDGE